MSTTSVTITKRASVGALRLSTDRKVAPLVRRQASKYAPAIANTFGLPSGTSCPGATEFCTSCYALNLERAYSASANLVRGNWDTLQACGDNIDAMTALLSNLVGEFDLAYNKLVATKRAAESDRVFRIHWDGDYYSTSYAHAWANVMRKFSHVQFWSYTRTYEVVPALYEVPNHALYLSVDQYNVTSVAPVLELHPRVHVAYCADTQANAAQLASTLGRPRPAVCPENVGRIPLVMHASGRRTAEVEVGADGKGACVACGLCVFGRNDVAFATKGK